MDNIFHYVTCLKKHCYLKSFFNNLAIRFRNETYLLYVTYFE